jgi:ectoine hydroxylase-related dioxygenase (phytanoyl-CoA dioxygenase family)
MPTFREFVTAMPYTVETDGFAIATGIVPESQRSVLLAALGDPDGAGSRGLLAAPAVRTFARCEVMMKLVTPHLGPDAQPVRAIFFDKTPASNWLVPWHQDLTIAVSSKVETPGFGPWSVKNGIPHVQPPVALLAQMLTVRLHLDDCDASNGALRVLPGSHQGGRLDPDQISAARAAAKEVVCEVAAGDALLMRPLLLHASSKSVTDRRRRVLHIEYCSGRLPEGLAWHDSA